MRLPKNLHERIRAPQHGEGYVRPIDKWHAATAATVSAAPLGFPQINQAASRSPDSTGSNHQRYSPIE